MPPTATVDDRVYAEKSESFALIVRELRRRARLTLQELAGRSNLAVSTISKIENGQLSPSYETILRLADGLKVDVAELFSPSPGVVAAGRRSITRRGQGKIHPSPHYVYEMLCTDLSRKHFLPQVARITARSIEDFPELSRHDGEEFVYVLSGVIELHTDFYEPTRLDEGDAAYFDSGMGHALVSVGEGEAVVLWVTGRSDGLEASEAKAKTRPRKP